MKPPYVTNFCLPFKYNLRHQNDSGLTIIISLLINLDGLYLEGAWYNISRSLVLKSACEARLGAPRREAHQPAPHKQPGAAHSWCEPRRAPHRASVWGVRRPRRAPPRCLSCFEKKKEILCSGCPEEGGTRQPAPQTRNPSLSAEWQTQASLLEFSKSLTLRVLAPPEEVETLALLKFSACSSYSATVVFSFYLKLLSQLLFFRYGFLCLCSATLLLHHLPSSSFLLLHHLPSSSFLLLYRRRQCFGRRHWAPSSTFFFPLFCSFFSVRLLCFSSAGLVLCFSSLLLWPAAVVPHFFLFWVSGGGWGGRGREEGLGPMPSFLFPLFLPFISSN